MNHMPKFYSSQLNVVIKMEGTIVQTYNYTNTLTKKIKQINLRTQVIHLKKQKTKPFRGD